MPACAVTVILRPVGGLVGATSAIFGLEVGRFGLGLSKYDHKTSLMAFIVEKPI
jgi:hypothetical protein